MKSMLKLLTGAFAAIFSHRTAVAEPGSQIVEERDDNRRVAETSKNSFAGVPDHWPDRHNVNMEPCDMIDGPCVCGGWHSRDEEWVKVGIARFGLQEDREQKTARLLEKHLVYDSSARATG